MIQDTSPRSSKMSGTNTDIDWRAWMDEHIALDFVGTIVLLGIFSYAMSLANS
jgi:hypothetical protein